LSDRLLDLPDDDALADELAHVQLRETSPGVYRMDHSPDRHDDRAVALALGAHTLLNAPATRRLNPVDLTPFRSSTTQVAVLGEVDGHEVRHVPALGCALLRPGVEHRVNASTPSTSDVEGGSRPALL
jgi:hypothetical protein